jgi:hypothetical protein
MKTKAKPILPLTRKAAKDLASKIDRFFGAIGIRWRRRLDGEACCRKPAPV